MIDIYLLEAGGSAHGGSDFPDESNWLGSIDLDEHRRLLLLFKKCELRGARFSYFEDSVLRLEEVRTMNEVFDKGFDEIARGDPETVDAYEKFKKILSAALYRNAGMAGFCD
ncbi:MAG TPA: hypothetical protein VF471_16245 [Pseudoxanthomonas sp.]